MSIQGGGTLAGKVIYVTGGGGRLGRQWCASLTADGAHVIPIDSDPTVLLLPDGVQADVTADYQLRAILAKHGVPDGLVCAAAIDAKPGITVAGVGAFEHGDWGEWLRVVDVNLTGAAMTCRVIGGAMAASGRGGSIALVGSMYGLVGPDQRRYADGFVKPAVYSVTKAGLIGLARWLATYWGPQQVRVNCVCFGALEDTGHPDKFRESMTAAIPLGRMAHDGEWSGTVRYLMSDDSSYMTGSVMTVDGGYTAW